MKRLLLAPVLAVVTGCSAAPAPAAPPFDLQAHRGGAALTAEGTIPAFARALDVGVDTLELDVQVTADGFDVVTHDRQTSARTCRDTAPAFPGDPRWPYLGAFVRDLTFAQVRTLDCGSTPQARWPGQRLAPGAPMPTLAEVAGLLRERRADAVRLNVETKVEAAAPEETAPREVFVARVVGELQRLGVVDRTSVQSFDWGALRVVHALEPRLATVALTEPDFLAAGRGERSDGNGRRAGRSPWLGGLDADDHGGSAVRTAVALDAGVTTLSPLHGEPEDGGVTTPGYRPLVTRELVDEAHAAGLRVVPWTVNDGPTMRALLDAGVDGMITDDPVGLRAVLAERGRPLPSPIP